MSERQSDECRKIIEEFEKCSCAKYYEVCEPYEFMMEIAKDVHLRTIVYRPQTEKSVPTIVMRTCYPHGEAGYRVTAQEYAKRGFAFIIQYCRGTGGSEGTWIPNINEREDGKCFLDWVNAQKWVKNIGYMGCSYLALTGWTIADIVPEKVKTMYLAHYGTHRYVSAYGGGLFRHDILTAWAMGNAGFVIDADYKESCRYMPHKSVDVDLWGKRIDWYREWIHNIKPEDTYWHTDFWGMLKEIPSRVKIPICMVEGWYDHHLASAIETWKSLPEDVKKSSRFVIGAWEHGYQIKLEGKNGNNFQNNDNLRAYQWFSDILLYDKASDSGIDYYLIGEDKWYSNGSFFEKKDGLKIYLAKGNKSEAAGSLKFKNEKENVEISYKYDPNQPVETLGAESCLCTNEVQGSLLQKEMGVRNDIVHFVSDRLTENIYIEGKIEIGLTVSTDAEDTAFVVKICEETEEGKAYNIRTGVIQLSTALDNQKYNPGEKVQIVFHTWEVAWKISKGSRIRVDITSSDFPQYAVHSNYSGKWDEQTQNRVANQTLYLGGEEESYILFQQKHK